MKKRTKHPSRRPRAPRELVPGCPDDEYHPRLQEIGAPGRGGKKNSRKQRRRIMVRDGPRCHYCRCKLTVDTSTLDHVVPLSKGGPGGDDNCVLACDECNTAKGDMPYERFVMLQREERREMLEQLIERFPTYELEMGESRGKATGRCFELATAFTWFCRGAGLHAELRRVDIWQPQGWEGHFVTQVDDKLVDWSARQYKEDAPLPAIFDNDVMAASTLSAPRDAEAKQRSFREAYGA